MGCVLANILRIVSIAGAKVIERRSLRLEGYTQKPLGIRGLCQYSSYENAFRSHLDKTWHRYLYTTYGSFKQTRPDGTGLIRESFQCKTGRQSGEWPSGEWRVLDLDRASPKTKLSLSLSLLPITLFTSCTIKRSPQTLGRVSIRTMNSNWSSWFG